MERLITKHKFIYKNILFTQNTSKYTQQIGINIRYAEYYIYLLIHTNLEICLFNLQSMTD